MIQTTRQQKTAEWLSLLLVLLLSGLVVLFIGRQVLIFRDYPFDYDEANHANGALALFLELRAGDIGGFFNEMWGQGFYPPGFSWLKAIAFLIFGPTTVTGRFFSLAALFLGCLVIYFLAREIDEKYGWLAGLTAVVLTLTVRPLLINAAQVMMEAPGLLATFTFLWLYVRALKRPTPLLLVLTSLLLTLTFFTKFTYGVIAVGTLGLMEISLLLGARNGKSAGRLDGSTRSLGKRALWLLGPFLLALLLWFVRPGNLAQFSAYATAQPPNQPWITVENLLFYPRSIALHQGPSPLFALITLASVIWAITQWRSAALRLLLLYFLVGMAVMTVNLPKNPRFIATIVPAAHLLTGLLLSWLVARLGSTNVTMRMVARGGTAVIALTFLVSLPTIKQRYTIYPSLLEVKYETDPEIRDILSWIYSAIPQEERFYILNYWDQLSPQLIAWDQAGQEYRQDPNLHFSEVTMPAYLVPRPSPVSIANLRRQIMDSGADYVVLFEGGPWGLPFWPEYTTALGDLLQPFERREFQIEFIDTGEYQDENLLRSDEWEKVKAESREKLAINVVIYQIKKA